MRRAALPARAAALSRVPPAGQAPRGWEEWIGVGFTVFAELAHLGLYRPEVGDGTVSGVVDVAALRFGRVCETYPDAVFCALLGHRPSPKRTPWGLQQRIAALRLKGIVDADGGLWHRTLDELDACAAAYAAYALAAGPGLWVGDPREGVIVLPVRALLPRYEKLPPARSPAAGVIRGWLNRTVRPSEAVTRPPAEAGACGTLRQALRRRRRAAAR